MELYSSEDEGGDFLLEVSNCFRGEESKDFGFLENHFLSKTLYDNLKLIYCQVAELSLSWYTKDTVDIFSKSEWLRNYQKENNLGEGFIRESLSGTINIVPYYEMFDRKKFDYLEKDGISYIPFDQHYSLEACFKADGDTVQDNIYIFNTEDPDNIIDMKIGCIKYLELAYKAKLFFNWQYAYALKDSIHNERLRKMLPVIFPFLELELNDFLNK
ncbi:MAG: hypothetical protein GQ574_17360 [Crocinitomix sp.]|nr:hypothetical protein [Crocinitomix sp.]